MTAAASRPRLLPRPLPVAVALLRDSLRRPAPFLVAALVAAALLHAGLLLPAAGPAGRARLAGSFAVGALFLLACAAGALVPAHFLAAARREKVLAALSAFPRGSASAWTGTLLCAGLLVAAWTAFAALLGASALFLATTGLDGDENPLEARTRILPFETWARVLTPGTTATFCFPPAAAVLPPGDVRGILEARLRLARPDSDPFGAPLALTLTGPDGDRVLASSGTLHGSSIPFHVPNDWVARGFTLELAFGPSPFDASIPAGGLWLEGRPVSLWSHYAVCALLALLAALLVASLSAAGSSVLSFPVAVGFAFWVLCAGLLSQPAADALEAWRYTGLLRAKEGVPDLPSWFDAFDTFLRGLLAVLPDIGEMNRATAFAEGRPPEPGAILRAAARTLAFAVPALILGTVFWRLRDPE